MRITKKVLLAASVSALLGATIWAQVPFADLAYGDSTAYQSQDEPGRDSISKDSAAYGKGVTASDQSNDKPDVAITQKIRKEIMAKKGMSVNAQNVKIVTIDGKVTLKGVVNSANEREIIGQMAIKAAGSKNVSNELQVK